MDENGALDLGAIKRSISFETCMIVASAPSFVTGLMDDVEKIAELGLRFVLPSLFLIQYLICIQIWSSRSHRRFDWGLSTTVHGTMRSQRSDV